MIRAELLKITTTTAARVAVGVGLGGLLLTQLTLVTLLPALAGGALGPGRDELGSDLPEYDLGTAAAQLDALSPFGASSGGGSIGIALIAVLVLGVLAGSTDYRHGGIVTTALAQPRRARIVAAKAGAVAIVGLVVGVAFAAVSALSLLVSLPIAGVELSVALPDALGVLGRGVIVVALMMLLGLAVGILARSQLVGVLAVFGILVAELVVQGIVQLVTGGLPLWAQLLPLSLERAAVSAEGIGGIAPVVAAAALAALVAAALALATAAMRARDI